MIYILWLLAVGFGVFVLMQIENGTHQKPPKELLNIKAQGFVFGIYRCFLRKPQYFHKSENTDGHILIVGGSGSGKTSGLVIPSILAWEGSVFAVDIKGELAAATAHRPGERKISAR
jgi:hypothetical protein